MSEKHSPGPWKIENGWVSGVDGLVVAVFASIGKPNDADARLIAAAPQMLDLLRRASEECTEDNGSCYHGKCVHRDIETLLDVIDGT